MKEAKAIGTKARRAVQLPLLWQLAMVAAGLFAGSGTVFGTAAPFGLAVAMGCAPGYMWGAVLGALGGALLSQPMQMATGLAGALLAALAGRTLFPRRFWPGALAGAGALVSVWGVLRALGYATTDQLLAAILTAMTAVALGYGLQQTAPRTPGRLCLWLAILAACAQSLAIGYLQPGLILLGAAVLLPAGQGGTRRALAAGIVMAVAVSLASPGCAYPAVVLLGAALAAGAWMPGDRPACCAVFFGGSFAGALGAPSLDSGVAVVLSAFLGLLLYLLLPTTLPDWLQEAGHTLPDTGALTGAAVRLHTVAQALTEVADTVNEIYEKQPARADRYESVQEFVAEELCRDCKKRETCWGANFTSTADGFARLRPILEDQGRPVVEQLPGQFSLCEHPAALCSAAARGYGIYRSRRESRLQTDTLRAALLQQYSTMAAAVEGLAGQVQATGRPEAQRTRQLEQLFRTLGLEVLECSVRHDLSGRLEAVVALDRMEFSPEECETLAQEVSRLCRRRMAPPDQQQRRTATVLLFCEKTMLSVAFGVAGHPARQVSGDAVRQQCDGMGHARMLLCDGMGTGRPAALDGTLACTLVSRLLQAGFGPGGTAKLVNVALSLKGEEEAGATLDLLTIDLYSGQTCLYKAGAAPSFLVRDGIARVLDANGLPVGVAEQVVGREENLTLMAGDWLVMVSDGALPDGETWLVQQLQLCARVGNTPQETADIVADNALRRASRLPHRDDITVAVCQIAQG